MNNSIEALRISPAYTSIDWNSLDQNEPADWGKAVKIVYDRLHGRFLKFANKCLEEDGFSGFLVLSIDCLLAETLQQFREGLIDGIGKSEKLIKNFLSSPRFQPGFDAPARKAFYKDIRCGLLHQAEAKGMWLIKRSRRQMLEKLEGGTGYILDVRQFHEAVCWSLEDYCKELVAPDQNELRANLWIKMCSISSVRVARGALVDAQDS